MISHKVSHVAAGAAGSRNCRLVWYFCFVGRVKTSGLRDGQEEEQRERALIDGCGRCRCRAEATRIRDPRGGRGRGGGGGPPMGPHIVAAAACAVLHYREEVCEYGESRVDRLGVIFF